MIVYHGTQTEKLVPEKTTSSRYGMPVLFFTDNPQLAAMYQSPNGSLFKADITPDKIIDFKGELTHSRHFRNLIYKLHQKDYGVVMIDNVYDRPDASHPLEKSIIMVVFDFKKIHNLQPCI